MQTPESKIVRSCYFQTSVLNKAKTKVANLNMSVSSLPNYCLKLCVDNPALLVKAQTLYMIDQAKSIKLQNEAKYKREAAEKKLIRSTLKLYKGNKTKTRKHLNISHAGLLNKMDYYKIKRTSYGGKV